ncbi:MAG: translation initiation factor IF-2 [Halanaerobiales bacterium]|nr:translation initiation factor IF-2 [Halanaerobiales bacterium]
MGKVRVYSLAKELGVKSNDLIEMLKDLGEEVASHMSTIEDATAKILREKITANNSKETKDDSAQSIEKSSNDKEVNTDQSDYKNNKNKKNKNAKKKKSQGKGVKVDGKVIKGSNQMEVAKEIAAIDAGDKNILDIKLPITVKSFAELLKANTNSLIGKLMRLGIMATINQNLEPETIELLAEDYGKQVRFVTAEDKLRNEEVEDRKKDLSLRPPIVTIMGHVDHGKTSLLDVIRQANVTATEAGGITQHIGAYQTEVDGKKITFLDTPGHEAFTSMRARGAQVTDIAILVVAADDGVMPQTVEAISHAKAAGVPLIVAINKIDKDNANPDRVLQELSEHGLVPEAWGGDTICVEVSALKQINIDGLLEMVLLVAEMEEIKANPNRLADGIVVEAELDKGFGPIATVLIKRGTLRIGDPVIVGAAFGRVRAMISYKGERVKEAGPSTPVVVLGLSAVPAGGDIFEVVRDERTARAIGEERAQQKRQKELYTRKSISLDDFFKQVEEGVVKDLNLIIKADVQGSVEAVRDSLLRLSNEEVRVMPIHTGVGAITETDIMLANASDAIVIGFNVRPDLNARKLAERDRVEIRTYRVIYKAIEEIKAALEGLLEPDYKEVVSGRAQVRDTFKVPKIGTVAGLYVVDGKLTRSGNVRLIRNGVVIHEGKISSLKRFKDDVKEVNENYECGLGIEGYNDIKEGDEIEVFVIEEIRRTLD